MPRAMRVTARRTADPVRAVGSDGSTRVRTPDLPEDEGDASIFSCNVPTTRAPGACEHAWMTWHQHARAALAQALSDVPPDAPTRCEGWEARHLAAHVMLREGSAVVGAGIVVPALADRAERAIQELGDSAATEGAYRDLVARVAAQPAGWHPMSWAGDAANLVELFVHTEDVRRGSGPVAPRPLEPELA